jgi:hypothetical protein
MTLIAAFRAREGGILLCADREENDGFSKREVEKISRLSLLQCQMFIAGAGYAPIIKKAQMACEEAISNAAKEGADLLSEHHDVLERALESTYARYVKNQNDEIELLIVMVPESEPRIPVLYRSHSAMLVQESLYAAGGRGKFISDFLADRLYQHGIGKAQLLLLASFIFREAGQAVSGVGLKRKWFLYTTGTDHSNSTGLNQSRNCRPEYPRFRTPSMRIGKTMRSSRSGGAIKGAEPPGIPAASGMFKEALPASWPPSARQDRVRLSERTTGVSACPKRMAGYRGFQHVGR